MEAQRILSMEIVAAKPEASDQRRLLHLQATTNRVFDSVTYVVKVYLEKPMPAAGSGYPLFVGNKRIDKYTEFPGGVYFKVHDPAFLEAHRGELVRFAGDADSLPGVDVADIALPQVAFPANPARVAAADVAGLPNLRDVLTR